MGRNTQTYSPFSEEDISMVKNELVGVWKLVASEFRRSDGSTVYPYGSGAIGMLIYDENGHMSAQIMNPDRPLFVSGNMRKGTPEEIKAAFDGYTAYFGNYKVDQQESTVTHRISGSHFPNWVGQDQKRIFEISGNRLTLKTPPIPAGNSMVIGIFIWEREVSGDDHHNE
jgi:hypothetical protein